MKSDIASSRAYSGGLPVAMKDLEVRCEQGETNAIVRVQEGILTEEPIPVAPLFELSGMLNGVSAKVLKDDECSTNVISRRFLGLHRRRFQVMKASVDVKLPKNGLNKTASQVIVNGTLRIGSHIYTSN